MPYHVRRAKPDNEDLLTEIQGIESLQKPLFDDVVLAQEVVFWLQVSSNSFLEVEQRIIP